MKSKFLLLSAAAVFGMFMMHSCNNDEYWDENFGSLAERRMTRSVTEDDSSDGVLDGTIDVHFNDEFELFGINTGYTYNGQTLYKDYQISLDFYEYTNTNDVQYDKTQISLTGSDIYSYEFYYIVNDCKNYPSKEVLDSLNRDFTEELTTFRPGSLTGTNSGNNQPLPFSYSLNFNVGNQNYKLLCNYPGGCYSIKKIR